jgi:hypothetical protein
MRDDSGRLDVSEVDPKEADDTAWRMFWAVTRVQFAECRRLHRVLNDQPGLYQAAFDLYKDYCKKHGVARAFERWRDCKEP